MAGMLSLIVVVVFSMASVEGTNPGFRARITQKGLDYANQQAIAALTEDIRKLKIPDQSGDASHVHYDVKNIQVTNFQPPGSRIAVVAGSGLQWTVTNADISVRADWHYKYKKGIIKISDGGSLSADVNGVSLSIAFKIGQDAQGKPTIATTSCSGSIGSVHVHFHGGKAFIYNLFKGLIEKSIKKMLEGQLCKIITKAVNEDAERQLARLPMTVVVAKKFLLDYRLVSAPTFTAQYLETDHKGEVVWKDDPQEPPLHPPSEPPQFGTDRMLYLSLSAFVGNSMAWAGFSHQYLHYNLSQSQLPPDARGMLNTSCSLVCIGKLIPQIGAKYPNTSVSLDIQATEPPVLKMTPGNILLVARGNIDLMAQLPEGKQAFLLSMNVSVEMNVTASIKEQLLIGQVEGAKVQLALVKSDVGDVKVNILQTLLNLVLNRSIIPMINDKAAQGVVLPVTGDIHFVSPQLLIQQDYLVVATDVAYKKTDQADGEAKQESSPLIFQPHSHLEESAQ